MRPRTSPSRPLARALTGAFSASVALALAWTPAVADAFCGFYVSGADASLFNNATNVVLMRDGLRTVLTMQNNYEGPPEDFAMVVPVPVVLHRRDVKVVPREIFERVDTISSPRLVEYWEQDPCPEPPPDRTIHVDMARAVMASDVVEYRRRRPPTVSVEARFDVGEYEVVVLGAADSMDLEVWLREHGYNIPPGAAELLRPYVHRGMKFFVAKVDTRKVEFKDGRATLSPLRFHYDAETFSLPTRLGLLNSGGTQDLIVHVLAREVRYQAANYPNVTIPTNLEVTAGARERFGEFYAALLDRVLEERPGAVVTEYSWTVAAGKCDPCPPSAMRLEDLMTLGADVLPTYERLLRGELPPALAGEIPGHFALTRLHTRYTADSLGDDLVFQAGAPITGGRGEPGADDPLERGALPGPHNRFQARYIIRHRWDGPVECSAPQFGQWGGPPRGAQFKPVAGRELALAARDAPLEEFLVEEEGSGGPRRGEGQLLPREPGRLPKAGRLNRDGWLVPEAGCASCSAAGARGGGWPSPLAVLALLGIGLAARRPRSRSHGVRIVLDSGE